MEHDHHVELVSTLLHFVRLTGNGALLLPMLPDPLGGKYSCSSVQFVICSKGPRPPHLGLQHVLLVLTFSISQTLSLDM